MSATHSCLTPQTDSWHFQFCFNLAAKLCALAGDRTETTYFLTFCPGTRWQGESWGVVSRHSLRPCTGVRSEPPPPARSPPRPPASSLAGARPGNPHTPRPHILGITFITDKTFCNYGHLCLSTQQSNPFLVIYVRKAETT